MLSQHNSQVVSSFAAIQEQAKRAKANAENLYAQAAADPRCARPPAQDDPAPDREVHQAARLAQRAAARAVGRPPGRRDLAGRRDRDDRQRGARLVRAGPQAAVQFALDQVGKPYVCGAAGPDAYDCSGLTMASWQQGGVSLPHSAADQYNYGHHVSFDQLQPGDLMFFYQPIGARHDLHRQRHDGVRPGAGRGRQGRRRRRVRQRLRRGHPTGRLSR